jgi:sigma-B regulation protein RsbU (phosphoserine phosphatase)
MMRRFINRHNQLSVVRSLNREFTAASEGGVFATAVVMTMDSRSNRLLISNAGHPPPLWYQAKRRRWTLLQPDTAAESGGLPFGIADDVPYQQFQLPLRVGDIILCYTDCLPEAKGPGGEFLGTAGLLQIANSLGNVNPSQLIPNLLTEIAKSDPEYAARDDVTCLAFRPNGLRPRVPVGDLFLAPFRWALARAGLRFGYLGWRRNAWDAPIESAGD